MARAAQSADAERHDARWRSSPRRAARSTRSLSRPSLLPQTYNETIDLESDRVFLANWPVLAVSSVVLDGLVIPPAVPTSSAPQARVFAAARRRRAARPAAGARLVWPALSSRVGKAWLSPIRRATPSRANVDNPVDDAVSCSRRAAPFGAWASDLGVIYASSGMALQPVSGAPSVGQYSVCAGVYRFNAADAGAALSLSYGFVPQDLAQAATTNSPPNAFAPPSTSACARNRSAARRRSPTISRAMSASVLALVAALQAGGVLMFAALDGAEALDDQLAALPGDIQARLEAKVRDLAETLAAKVRDEKLSGQSLQTRSGALKASIAAEIAQRRRRPCRDGRILWRRQIRRHPGIWRSHLGARDLAGQGAGVGVPRRRGRSLRPPRRTSRLHHSRPRLSKLKPRGIAR